jgi:hypothetical protein
MPYAPTKWKQQKYNTIQILFAKHVPTKQTTEQRPLLGSRFLIKQQLDYNNGRAVFSTWSVPRCCKQGTRLELSSVRKSVKRVLEPEGIVEAATSKRLVTDWEH